MTDKSTPQLAKAPFEVPGWARDKIFLQVYVVKALGSGHFKIAGIDTANGKPFVTTRSGSKLSVWGDAPLDASKEKLIMGKVEDYKTASPDSVTIDLTSEHKEKTVQKKTTSPVGSGRAKNDEFLASFGLPKYAGAANLRIRGVRERYSLERMSKSFQLRGWGKSSLGGGVVFFCIIHDNAEKNVELAVAGVEWTVDDKDLVVLNLFQMTQGSVYVTMASKEYIEKVDVIHAGDEELVKILLIDLFAFGHCTSSVSLTLAAKTKDLADLFKQTYHGKSKDLEQIQEYVTKERCVIEDIVSKKFHAAVNKDASRGGSKKRKSIAVDNTALKMARKKLSTLTSDLRVVKANLRKAQSAIKRHQKKTEAVEKSMSKERVAAVRDKDALAKKYERQMLTFKSSQVKKNKKRSLEFKQQIALLKECLDQAKKISAGPTPPPAPAPVPAPVPAPTPAPAPATTGTTVPHISTLHERVPTPRPRPYVHDLPPRRRVRRSLHFPGTLPPYVPEGVYDPMYPSCFYM
jgi:hypothetical protein